MSTKSQLITSNDTKIRNNASLIDQDTDHATFNAELITELFPTTYTMYLSPVTPDAISYELNFSKIGNLVTVSGFIKNGFSYMIGSQDLLTIGNSLYFAKTGESTICDITGNSTLLNGLVEITTDKIYLLTNLGAGNSFRINATYKTND